MADPNNILPESDASSNEDELLQYVTGALPDEQKTASERKAFEAEFENDAIEGLHQFKQKDKLDAYARALNAGLQEQLASRKQKAKKRQLKDQHWFLLTVLIILAICILAFVVVNMYRRNNGI